MPIEQKPSKRTIKGVMDIVLCIDATRSMEPCINELKNNLKNFIDSISSTILDGQQVTPDWRARVIYFRDLDADKEAIRDFPFVSTSNALKTQLESIKAEGGGDAPESFLDAIYLAITKSEWRENALHAVIAFTDAPPKEQLHTSTIESGQDPSVATVINAFTRDKYQRLFVYCPTHYIYKKLETIPKSIFTYVDTQTSVYNGLKNINFKDIMETLGKTLTLSSSEVLRA